jgi:hypothetical protein
MSKSDSVMGQNVSGIYSDKPAGTQLQPGVYVGVVKNVYDTDRAGKLQVWIPDLGGQENDTGGWRTVRYASPFMGSTNSRGVKGAKSQAESFENNGMTYGLWAVPPDIDNQVLCTFINGDPGRGFWFACIMDRKGHSALPSNSGGEVGVDVDLATLQNGKLKSAIQQAMKIGKVYVPLAEFNPHRKTSEDIQDRKRVIHEMLTTQYISQGLLGDPVRGPRNASAQRDMPSQVYGFSTPGKPMGRNGIPAKPEEVYEREGGHVFVMDDGDYSGAGAHMKLRSSSGHQILMDDDAGSIYVINASGSSWFEMTQSGQVFAYSSGGVTMRTRGDFNIHSDQTFRVMALKGIQMRTDGDFVLEGKNKFDITGGKELLLFGNQKLMLFSEKGKILADAQGDISIKSKANLAIDAEKNISIADNKAEAINLRAGGKRGLSLYDKNYDTVQDGATGLWKVDKTKPASPTICPIFPTHEPWDRMGFDVNTRQAVNQASGAAPSFDSPAGQSSKNLAVDANGQITTTANGDIGSLLKGDFLQRHPGIASALKNSTLPSKMVPKISSYDSGTAPNASQPIGNMTQSDTSSYLTGVAFAKSYGSGQPAGMDYNMRQGDGAGRYGLTQDAIESAGLLKPGASAKYPNGGALDRTDTWKDRAGMTGFLNNPSAQEEVAQSYAVKNYSSLVQAGVIPADGPSAHTAGMLAVAHEYGADAAVNWARTGTISGTNTANKIPPNQLYAAGSTAVSSAYSTYYR